MMVSSTAMSAAFVCFGIGAVDSVMATEFTFGTVASTDTAIVFMLEHTAIHANLAVNAFMSRRMAVEAHTHGSLLKASLALTVVNLETT